MWSQLAEPPNFLQDIGWNTKNVFTKAEKRITEVLLADLRGGI